MSAAVVNSSPRPDATFEGLRLPGPGFKVRPLEGEFGDFLAVRVEGFQMWDTYEVRSSRSANPLSFFLHNHEPDVTPYWAARFPQSCGINEILSALDASQDTCLSQVFGHGGAGSPGHSIAEVDLRPGSPLWSAGVVIWKGGHTVGLSPQAFSEARSWGVLHPDELDKYMSQQLHRHSGDFPLFGRLKAARIAAGFGSIQFEMSTNLNPHDKIEITSSARNGHVAEEFYGRLDLGLCTKDSGLSGAIAAILQNLKSSGPAAQCCESPRRPSSA